MAGRRTVALLTYGSLLAIVVLLLSFLIPVKPAQEPAPRQDASDRILPNTAPAPPALSMITLPEPPAAAPRVLTAPSAPVAPTAMADLTPKPEVAERPAPAPPLKALRAPPPASVPATPLSAFLESPLQPQATPPRPRQEAAAPAVPVARAIESAAEPLTPTKPVIEVQTAPPHRRAEISASKSLSESPVAAIVPSTEALQEGRALLRILEHGSGPNIEIAWPSSMSVRELLYATFRDCFGMRVAVMTDAGVLYALDDGSRDAWDLDLDTYSGFVRHPEGRVTATERGLLRNVPAAAPGARLVRIFPRRVDAVLLGGLQALIGSAYGEARSIRAAYRYATGGVAVTGIQIDGRSVTGSIDLAASTPRRCRAA